jgi:hypothetical protein
MTNWELIAQYFARRITSRDCCTTSGSNSSEYGLRTSSETFCATEFHVVPPDLATTTWTHRAPISKTIPGDRPGWLHAQTLGNLDDACTTSGYGRLNRPQSFHPSAEAHASRIDPRRCRKRCSNCPAGDHTRTAVRVDDSGAFQCRLWPHQVTSGATKGSSDTDTPNVSVSGKCTNSNTGLEA